MSTELAERMPQPQTSRLFSLPPEIRNRIYELLLHVTNTDKVYMVKFSNVYWHAPPDRRPSVLTLLLTCRQIFEEARGIFYAINHLLFAESPAGSDYLRGFLSNLSKDRLKAVNAITIVLPESLEAAGLLWMINQLCPLLRVLHVIPAYISASADLDQHLTALTLRFENLEEFKMMHPPWLKTCGARVTWLRSVEEQVQQKFVQKQLAEEQLAREETLQICSWNEHSDRTGRDIVHGPCGNPAYIPTWRWHASHDDAKAHPKGP